MNIVTSNVLSLAWLKLVSPSILFGLYYGLLATLPVGPPQILCMRSFLLGGNLSGLVSLSGSMLAQLVVTASIYCSPIYLFLLKPHLLTVAVIPYTLIFCLAIKDLPNYQILRPVTSLRDSRVVGLFCSSFLFQIINPILLPNPVLARLIHLFFFRYSGDILFVIASFWGWLIGHITFSYLSRLLLIRVERDSPIIYLLVKRAIYTTFSIVFIINAVVYLGRAPVSFWTQKFINDTHDKDMFFWDIADFPDFLWWFFKPWPISFFDPSRGNRGNRYIEECRYDMHSTVSKGRLSTYFFDRCVTDGKQRLSFAASPSLSIFEKELERSLRKSRRFARTRSSYRDWISEKLVRNEIFQKELTDRVKLLDAGSSFSKVTERRTRLTGGGRRRIPHAYDPFVNNSRMRIPVPQTFLTGDELDITQWESNELETRRKTKRSGRDVAKTNSVEDWISTKNRKWRRGSKNPLPWETLPAKTRRIVQFMFKHRLSYDSDVQNIMKKIESSSKPGVTWEEIMNLDPRARALFFIYLKEEERCYTSNQIELSNIFSVSSQRRAQTMSRGAYTLRKEDLSVEFARDNEIYFDNYFDVPGADSDIRYRKLRNVGITSAKEKPESTRLVKRYARVSDFRRKFLKGSMRSRRRKTLLWKILQEKVRSAFFLRLMEIPILSQLPIEQVAGANPETTPTGSEKNMYYQFGQQLDISPLIRRSLSESKLARSAIAARSDIGPIHNGRGYMLVFQSRFRKFIKLPVLIAFKTTSRILLRQQSEWNKDWTEWEREIHINCTFDGEEFSQDQLPPRWLREGMQVKILYPFRLKPWHTDVSKKRLTPRGEYAEAESIRGQKSNTKRMLRRKRPKFTYLTALGYQTDIPFGTIQKHPSFWKPVRKELIRACRDIFSLRTRQAYHFLDSNFNLEKILKPSLISLMKLNSFSEAEIISTDSVSTDKTGTESASANETNEANEAMECKSNNCVKNGGSLDIVGEVRPASSISEELVTQLSVEKENFVAGNVPTRFASMSNKEGIDEPDVERTQADEVALNDRLKDIDVADFANFEGNKSIGSKEMTLRLRIFVAEEIDKFVSVVSASYLTIGRNFIHYFDELVSLHTQLAEVTNNTIRETDVLAFGPRNRLSRFDKIQPLSQACLCGDIWEIGMKRYLDLHLLVGGDEGSSNYKEGARRVKNWSPGSTLPEQSLAYSGDVYRPSIDCDSDTAKFIGSGEINNCTGGSISCIDEMSDEVAKDFLDKYIIKSIEDWGLLKKLRDLDASNWNKWLDRFYRCNLPLAVWRNVAPHRWRVSSDCLGELGDIGNRSVSELRRRIFQGGLYNYSIYAKKPLLRDRIRNLSRLRRRRYLLQNVTDSVRNGDIEKLSIRRDVFMQRRRSENRIQRMGRIGRSGINRFVHFQNSDTEIKFNSKFDLMPWLIPDLAKAKGFFKKKGKRFRDPAMRDTSQYLVGRDISSRFQEVSDELHDVTLEDREEVDYIFQWKWKSEVELEKLRNLVALTRMLGNDQDLVALCDNTDVDSYLLNFYFAATTKLGLFYDLCIVSAHRLPILLDDQNLVFKMINPLLKFKSRSKNGFKKRLCRNVYSDTYISKLLLLAAEKNKKQSHIYNIEDLLLPRRRQEFRFLRSLLISRSPKLGAQPFDSTSKIERTHEGKEFQPSGLSEVQKVKRFLWPSHRLEELACTGRFCFNVTTGSRFAMLKIRMYPTNRS
uniref:conserved hypothetical chloroplast protein Ycf1 n=1 Tax=Microlepia speluncae TaxID=449865 RepID=UPI001FA8176A|nr:conserved hypothetical chloroplast protein Ycf1 [Microlepia speluncae]ULU27968.1 conserved hypothetical chloroplast protein Ycf1 [Microlepia speluncae]